MATNHLRDGNGRGEDDAVAEKRLLYLDSFKVVIVAWVASHAIAGYAGMNWTCADAARTRCGRYPRRWFGLLILPFAAFVMALLFLWQVCSLRLRLLESFRQSMIESSRWGVLRTR